MPKKTEYVVFTLMTEVQISVYQHVVNSRFVLRVLVAIHPATV